MATYYIGSAYEAGAQNATLTASSANVSTTSAAFATVSVGDLIIFEYTTDPYKRQGMWALVQTWTDSTHIILDRTSAYSGTVPFKFSHFKYQLDTVNDVKFNVQSTLEKMGMPGQTSRSTICLDMTGVIRTITITGTFSDTAVNVATYLGAIDALLNGTQFSQYPYIITLPFLPVNSNNGMWYLVGLEKFEYYFIKNSTSACIAKYSLVAVERS